MDPAHSEVNLEAELCRGSVGGLHYSKSGRLEQEGSMATILCVHNPCETLGGSQDVLSPSPGVTCFLSSPGPHSSSITSDPLSGLSRHIIFSNPNLPHLFQHPCTKEAWGLASHGSTIWLSSFQCHSRSPACLSPGGEGREAPGHPCRAAGRSWGGSWAQGIYP